MVKRRRPSSETSRATKRQRDRDRAVDGPISSASKITQNRLACSHPQPLAPSKRKRFEFYRPVAPNASARNIPRSSACVLCNPGRGVVEETDFTIGMRHVGKPCQHPPGQRYPGLPFSLCSHREKLTELYRSNPSSRMMAWYIGLSSEMAAVCQESVRPLRRRGEIGPGLHFRPRAREKRPCKYQSFCIGQQMISQQVKFECRAEGSSAPPELCRTCGARHHSRQEPHAIQFTTRSESRTGFPSIAGLAADFPPAIAPSSRGTTAIGPRVPSAHRSSK